LKYLYAIARGDVVSAWQGQPTLPALTLTVLRWQVGK
jgi:hypothetical protein